MVVLLGPSRSGKSTLLNIMGGLDHASSGHLFFKDVELTSLDDRSLTLNCQMADHSNKTHPLDPEGRGRHQPEQ